MKPIEIPTIKELEELENETNDDFTKKLISELKNDLSSNSKENDSVIKLHFQRIKKLVNYEKNKEKLKKINSKKYDDIVYELQITKKTGKKINDKIKGEFTLSVFSRMIQEWFDLEPLHLYEFKIGDCKYGPECDEWEEIFDFLDSYKLGAAISAANLKKGDQFKFLYDFGDKISFKIKIINVEE